MEVINIINTQYAIPVSIVVVVLILFAFGIDSSVSPAFNRIVITKTEKKVKKRRKETKSNEQKLGSKERITTEDVPAEIKKAGKPVQKNPKSTSADTDVNDGKWVMVLSGKKGKKKELFEVSDANANETPAQKRKPTSGKDTANRSSLAVKANAEMAKPATTKASKGKSDSNRLQSDATDHQKVAARGITSSGSLASKEPIINHNHTGTAGKSGSKKLESQNAEVPAEAHNNKSQTLAQNTGAQRKSAPGKKNHPNKEKSNVFITSIPVEDPVGEEQWMQAKMSRKKKSRKET